MDTSTVLLGTLPMTDPLQASQLDPAFVEHLEIFEQLIGTWICDVTTLLPDGTQKQSTAEWHFSWVLGGRAMADTWISPPRSQGGPGETSGEWGCALRFYDPKIQGWRYTWHGPTHHLVIPFIAHLEGDKLQLEGHPEGYEPEVVIRWVYDKITPTELHWHSETSTDSGLTWTIDQLQRCHRPA